MGRVLYLLSYVSYLKSLNNVVEDCFSSVRVNPDLSKHLTELKKNFEGTDLSETLKFHVTLESIHRVFEKIWDRYKIYILSYPKYNENLKKNCS